MFDKLSLYGYDITCTAIVQDFHIDIWGSKCQYGNLVQLLYKFSEVSI